MKEYCKPKIVVHVLQVTDIVTISIGAKYGQEFDNGGEDIDFGQA